MPEGSDSRECAVRDEHVGAPADAVLLREAYDVAVHRLDARGPGEVAALDEQRQGEHRPSRAHYAGLS